MEARHREWRAGKPGGIRFPQIEKRNRLLLECPQIIVRAFFDLSASRSIGFDRNPISTSDALAWMEIHGIMQPVRRQLWRYIQAMDLEYLKLSRSDEGKTNGNPSGKH